VVYARCAGGSAAPRRGRGAMAAQRLAALATLLLFGACGTQAALPLGCQTQQDNGKLVLLRCINTINEDLDLSSQGLDAIAPDAFKGLTVRDLVLDSNAFEQLGRGAFTGLTVTGSLKLNNLQQLRAIKSFAFSNATVHMFYLTGGTLSVIEKDAFSGLTVTSPLNLASNHITTVVTKAFTGVTATGLILDDQGDGGLRTIAYHAFEGARFGSDGVQFGNAVIHSFFAESFARMQADVLFIGPSAHLTKLHASAFTDATIGRLVVQRNTALTDVALAGAKLGQVELTGNAVTSFNASSFAQAQLGGELRIDEAALHTIADGAFQGASIQGDLVFAGATAMSKIHAFAFQGALVEGNLRFPTGSQLTLLVANAFASVTVAGDLDLQQVGAAHIQEDAFHDAVVHGVVLLDHNALTPAGVESLAFKGLTAIQGLSLDGNAGLTELAFSMVDESNITGTFTLPRELTLVDWACIADFEVLKHVTLIAPGMAAVACTAAGQALHEWHGVDVCAQCPPGYYCPEGDTQRPSHAAPVECPKGFGMLSAGATDIRDCKPCLVSPEFHHGGWRNCNVEDPSHHHHSGSGGSHSGSHSGSGTASTTGSGSGGRDIGDENSGTVIVIVLLVIVVVGLLAIMAIRQRRLRDARRPKSQGYRQQAEEMGYEMGSSFYRPPVQDEYSTM